MPSFKDGYTNELACDEIDFTSNYIGVDTFIDISHCVTRV